MVRLIPARHCVAPRLAKDYTVLKGIGDKAYVATEAGGWEAGALKGSSAVVISVDGGKSSKSTAVTVLKMLASKI